MSLGSAIGSGAANASTRKTFFVGFALPSTFGIALARIVPRFCEDFLPPNGTILRLHFQQTRHWWHRDCWPLRSLLCCQLLLKICGTHGEKNSESHVFGLLLSSAFPVSLLRIFPSSNGVREVVFLGVMWRQKSPAVAQTSSSCQWAIQRSWSSPFVPNLIPVQLHELHPELLLRSLK